MHIQLWVLAGDMDVNKTDKNAISPLLPHPLPQGLHSREESLSINSIKTDKLENSRLINAMRKLTQGKGIWRDTLVWVV